MKTSPPTSLGFTGSGCSATVLLAVAFVAGLFFSNQPQARADGAHFAGRPAGAWSSGGRSFPSGGYSSRPRTSIGISFYEGFGPRPSPYYYPGPVYPYSYSGPVYSAPVYSGPVYVPAPVVYAQAPVYYGAPVVNRPVSQVSVREEQVGQAQEALRRLGYYKGNIDGLSGPGMRSALRAYQVDRGLPVTGRLDENTFQALGM